MNVKFVGGGPRDGDTQWLPNPPPLVQVPARSVHRAEYWLSRDGDQVVYRFGGHT